MMTSKNQYKEAYVWIWLPEEEIIETAITVNLLYSLQNNLRREACF